MTKEQFKQLELSSQKKIIKQFIKKYLIKGFDSKIRAVEHINERYSLIYIIYEIIKLHNSDIKTIQKRFDSNRYMIYNIKKRFDAIYYDIELQKTYERINQLFNNDLELIDAI